MNRSPRIKKRLAAKRSYQAKPFLRRSQTIESVLAGAIVTALIVVGIASRIGLLVESDVIGKAIAAACAFSLLASTIAVLFVCILTLTGPIYKRQLDFSTGELETYGRVDKLAALTIACLVVGAISYIGYRYISLFG
ncbi:hypothetical protein [Rhodopirellula sp. SWK7]|uniref:hypothetical protein n=1 Tax=Rhodopirellula sp. SWK7 TaxID=595460 RepID=UPI0002BEC2C7|nr:hypothetical protein [Rhodopirellula sp. SWK7]EMI47417.1 membrane protein [Rhodopirellula sp. SWK7]